MGKRKTDGAWLVIVGLCIYVGLARGGLHNSVGQFMHPISVELGVPIGSVAIITGIAAAIGILWSPIAGNLLAKHSVKLIAILAIVFHGAGFALMGLAKSLWGMYLIFALTAVGSGISCQLIAPVLVSRRFGDRKGLMMGVVMAVGGVVGALMQALIGNSIETNGWRSSFLWPGILTLVLGVLVSLIAFGNRKQSSTGAVESAPPELPGLDCSRAFRTLSFLFAFLAVFCLMGVSSFIQYLSPLAIEAGFGSAVGGYAMSLCLLGATLGSVLLGRLCDKKGARFAMGAAIVVGLVSLLLFLTLRTQLVMYLGATLLFGVYGACMGTVVPQLVGGLFGYRDFSRIYGRIVVAMNVAIMLLVPLYGYVYDALQSYSAIILVMLGLLMLSSILLILAKRYKPQV